MHGIIFILLLCLEIAYIRLKMFLEHSDLCGKILVICSVILMVTSLFKFFISLWISVSIIKNFSRSFSISSQIFKYIITKLFIISYYDMLISVAFALISYFLSFIFLAISSFFPWSVWQKFAYFISCISVL